MAATDGGWSDPGRLVLGSLANGPKHGYAITADVEATTGVRLGPGTLYGALARLEARGLVRALPSDDRRTPYELTADGASVLKERAEAMRTVQPRGAGQPGRRRARLSSDACSLGHLRLLADPSVPGLALGTPHWVAFHPVATAALALVPVLVLVDEGDRQGGVQLGDLHAASLSGSAR